ncbi:hypothetical protein [Piscinibacter sp.]|jgi:hypothetical protein|uniref:hypothetical protein n=1 Tax=Piscinibacter sp. TaxID=1903157 RepID=UPI002F3E5F5B
MDHLSNTGHETAVCWIDLSWELAAHLLPGARSAVFQRSDSNYADAAISLLSAQRSKIQKNTRVKRQPLWLEKRRQ